VIRGYDEHRDDSRFDGSGGDKEGWCGEGGWWFVISVMMVSEEVVLAFSKESWKGVSLMMFFRCLQVSAVDVMSLGE
jgi:hypothetical protein